MELSDNYFDNIKLKYTELLKTIIVMTLPADNQIEILGVACPGADLSIEFNIYYSEMKSQYYENKLLNSDEIVEFDKLESFFKERVDNSDFLFNFPSHPDADILNKMANNCLINLRKDNLTLKLIPYAIESISSYNKEAFVIQRKFTEIIEK